MRIARRCPRSAKLRYSNSIYDSPGKDDNTIGHGIEQVYDRLEEATVRVDWEGMPWPEFPLAKDLSDARSFELK